MATQIQVRRDTTANWDGATVTLAEGEIGLEMETSPADGSKVNGVKIGDGATEWGSLEYATLVFEHPNTVVDVDNNTLYIKGRSSQTGKLLLVEGSDADVLLSIADNGTILFNEGGAGQVDFGGGSNGTGVTIQANGDIELTAASRIEMGSTIAGVTSAGSGVEMTTETEYGRLHLKSTTSANDTDDMITVTKGTSAKFIVEANGDIETLGKINSSGIVTCQGITNSTTAISANTKVTNVTDPVDLQDAATKAYVDGYNKAGHATFNVSVTSSACTALGDAVTVGRINSVALTGDQITIDLDANFSSDEYVTIISGHAVGTTAHGHPMTFYGSSGTNGLSSKTTSAFKFKPRQSGSSTITYVVMVSAYEA